jgi:uncharacterized protein YecT (DUF1311 family)
MHGRHIALGLIAAVGVVWLGFPAYAAAQSFDCRKASTPTERMICADPEIAKLDSELGSRYQQLLVADAGARSRIGAWQLRWLAGTRNAATRPADLRQHYVNRIATIGTALRCSKGDITDWTEIAQCEHLSLEQSEAELDALYRKRLADPDVRAEPDIVLALRASQEAWLKYRDAQCNWDTIETRGGNLRPMQIDACANGLTEARIKELTVAP